MNWHLLKEEIYYEDGSLRDIYIFDTSPNDWKKWVELVNKQYKVDFYNGQNQQTTERIEFEAIETLWSGKTDLLSGATVFINNFQIKCYFFGWEEFENDICPKEIKSEDDHIQLLNYLKAISTHLDKKVILTAENMREVVLIEVVKDKVKIIRG
jgi:hypothetical protein